MSEDGKPSGSWKPRPIWPEMIFAWQNYRRFWMGPASGLRPTHSRVYLLVDGLPRDQHKLLKEVEQELADMNEDNTVGPLWERVCELNSRYEQLLRDACPRVET